MKEIKKWLLSDVPVEAREIIRSVAKRHKTTIGNALYIIAKFYKQNHK